jgi:hypothetical protein
MLGRGPRESIAAAKGIQRFVCRSSAASLCCRTSVIGIIFIPFVWMIQTQTQRGPVNALPRVEVRFGNVLL